MIKHLAKDTAIYGIIGAASRFVHVLLVPVYTRLFAPDEYGLLDLLTVTSTILLLLSGLQIESGIARSYFESKEGKRRELLVGTGLSLYIVSISIVVGVTWLVFRYFYYGYENVTWNHMIPLLVALFPGRFLALWLVILRLEQAKLLFGLLSVGDILLSAVFSILAVVTFELGIPGIFWGILISKLIWAVLGYIFMPFPIHPQWSPAYNKEILVYSIPLVPAVLTKWLQNYANRFLLVSLVSLSLVGVFSLGVKVAAIIALIDTAFRQAWSPYALQIMEEPGSQQKYARMLDVYLVGMFFCSATLGALGPFVVQIVATSEYSAAGDLIGFLTMGLMWSGALQILLLGINVVRKTYWGLVGFATGTVINLIALWLTVPWFGIVAAAVTYLFGTAITALIILFTSQAHYHIPYRYNVLGAVLLCSFILPLALYIIPMAANSISNNLPMVTIMLRLGCAWIFSFGIILIGISSEDQAKILRMLKRRRQEVFAR